jgi:hypothetical protein
VKLETQMGVAKLKVTRGKPRLAVALRREGVQELMRGGLELGFGLNL